MRSWLLLHTGAVLKYHDDFARQYGPLTEEDIDVKLLDALNAVLATRAEMGSDRRAARQQAASDLEEQQAGEEQDGYPESPSLGGAMDNTMPRTRGPMYSGGNGLDAYLDGEGDCDGTGSERDEDDDAMHRDSGGAAEYDGYNEDDD